VKGVRWEKDLSTRVALFPSLENHTTISLNYQPLEVLYLEELITFKDKDKKLDATGSFS
jgi:hypothetical protein